VTCSISSSAAPGPQKSRATRRLTSSAPALLSADGRQRLDERPVGDHRVVLDRLGQLEHLEQVEGARGEDGQATGALGVPAAVTELPLEALEVGTQRRLRAVAEPVVVAHPAGCSVQARAHLGAAGRRGREFARIEVDEERKDLCVASADHREAAQALGSDVVGLHAATLPRGAPSSRAGHTSQAVLR
jgi:hypothetical protein